MLLNYQMEQSMSDESRFTSQARQLREEERELIVSMLSRAHYREPVILPLETQVIDMQDGGMGGIRFVRSESRHFGKELARGKYMDADGVPVSITINADDRGGLFELDFWKVDFSALKHYPRPLEIEFEAQ